MNLSGILVLAFAALMPLTQTPAGTRIAQTVWDFDSLGKIGGHAITVEGHPKIVESPVGKAIEFDGVGDSLFIDVHPLAGAETFTFEAYFRPDGGAEEQRWFHIAERDSKTGLLTDPAAPGGDPNARFLFEIRVKGSQWYLDAFARGNGYNKALMFPEKLHPVGQWHHVAQVFDGKTYRSYVNGELQGEAEIAYRPQGAGATSIGVRMNKVNYFHGAIAKARFTAKALSPSEFMKPPRAIR
jgi:Concanavalin A-like lectin/glucanases superfamily